MQLKHVTSIHDKSSSDPAVFTVIRVALTSECTLLRCKQGISYN